MSIELAQLHKIYASNKYSPNVFFLNPFTEVLFTPNWVWPEEYIAQKKHSVKKPYSNSDNLKQKIKEWFQSIDFQTRLNCLTIKDRKFIQTLCYFLPSYNSENLYNMKSRKCIKNIEVSQKNLYVEKGLRTVIENFQVAFLKQPILHLSKNSQKFLSNQLIKWMEIISHKKIFQLANKIKQSQQLEDNILWFSEHSFQSLECFLVNEFEKAIIRGYFSRDRIQSNYLMDIREFCLMEKDNLKGKNVEYELIGYPLLKTMQLTGKEVDSRFSEMKDIEEMYEREKQRMIQRLIEDQLQPNNKDQAKKKRRRVRRKNNKGESNEIVNDQNSPQKNTCSTKNNSKSQSSNKKQKNQKNSPSDQNQRSQNIIETINEQQKSHLPFATDELSVISKCEDSEYHETDVTFDKFLDNEDRMYGIEEKSQQKLVIKEEQTMIEIEQKNIYEQTIVKVNMIQSQSTNKIPLQTNQTPTTTTPPLSPQDSANALSKLAKKKKSKKEKLTQNLHQQLIKSIRNNAFTEFIDGISIESNNLYNYKLSAYQFIVFFISSLLPTTNITLFGSNAVGLSLASSDIDIMISNIRWNNISQVREVLYHIGNEISKMGWVVDYRLILNAKVPVLKLFIDPKIDYFGHSPLKYTAQTNLQQSIVIKADIIVNIEGDQNIGCESTLLMKQWLSDHPQLQRIILFFKYILWYYGLNENYRGGICSYCLFLMVVHCLFKKIIGVQQLQTFNITNGNTKTALAQMLHDENQGTYIIQILKYYSQTFDPKNDQISITKQLKQSSQSSIQIKQKSLQYNNTDNMNNNQQQENSINFINVNNNANTNTNKRNLNLKIVDPINGQYIESSFSKFQQIQQLFSMILVQSMKLDNQHKYFLNNNIEINDEFNKLYLSLSQSTSYNVITKNSDQLNDGKVKKVIKKVQSKIKKYQQLKYSVKDIVSIGFKIGIDNWMGSNNNGYQDKFHL